MNQLHQVTYGRRFVEQQHRHERNTDYNKLLFFCKKKIITFHRRTHFFLLVKRSQDTRNCYDNISTTTRTKNNKI